MSDEIENEQGEYEEIDGTAPNSGENSETPSWESEGAKVSALQGLYKTWFIDYASYVILERAVPHLNDGLKPVQRRILHTMSLLEDGRYNKVANIVGATMSYHPHGDASIGDALVQLGQKNLLIDTQGNWGNILTGDSAAAPRYIEARLTPFALDVVFNPKTTVWKLSYDGRNNEPVTLPVKFPLLLAHGVEGIAVGLASKILPHNFNELIDASIAYLKNEPFTLYPDFQTGGYVDVSRYNDGLRGGVVKIRSKITKLDAKTLVISDIPYGKTTSSLIDSILKANEKGKIKIRKVDDNTAANVEILVHLPAGASPDKTIDALYAFTDCELPISPNSCVISNNKPHFMGVSEILKNNTDTTVELLHRELEIRYGELSERWHMSSLEKIFIEERIYKDREFEESTSTDEACAHIDSRLEPFYPQFMREVTKDDILKLLEIKMARILKFNSSVANEKIKAIEEEMEQIRYDMDHIVDYAIAYFKRIKKQYGKNHPRLTEIRSFENIEAAKVVVQNEKLYINREDGFIGYGLKKDEYLCDCSDIDDVIIFYNDGRYIIKKVEEKMFVGKDIMHVAIFKKNDTRTIYNAAYTDGKTGISYVKRFAVSGITRDKEYNLTQETPNSKILYFSANPNGEAEVLKVMLKPKPRLRTVVFDFDFSTLAIKGRASMGNILAKTEIHKVVLKRKGGSTLGGRKIWFEPETLRLNTDERGKYLGEFQGKDQILVIYKNGDCTTTGFDLEMHYEDNYLIIEKFDPHKIWTAVYWDGEQSFYYIKRFKVEGGSKPVSIIGENSKSKLTMISDEDHPRFQINFGGDDKWRTAEEIDAFEFIGEKSIRAKGKRLTAYGVSKIVELEPLIPTVRTAQGEDGETSESEAEPENETPSLF